MRIEASVLAEGLRLVSRFLPSRPLLPVLGGVLISVRDGRVGLYGTDSEAGAEVILKVEGEEEAWEAVAPAGELGEIARSCQGETMALGWVDSGESRLLGVWVGNAEFNLSCIPPEDMPRVAAEGGKFRLCLPAPVLGASLEDVSFACSQDPVRPVLTGIRLVFGEGELEALATDGYRVSLSRVATGSSLGAGGPQTFVLPGRALRELGRALPEEGEVEVEVGEGVVSFRVSGPGLPPGWEGVRVSVRTMEAPYPNVLEIVPREYPTRARVARESFASALSRVSVLSSSPEGKKSGSLPVRLEFLPPGSIVLAASSPGLGRAREVVEGEVEGRPVEVWFNERFLREGVRACRSPEVRLELSGSLSAARVSPLGGPEGREYMYVVMPMRPPET